MKKSSKKESSKKPNGSVGESSGEESGIKHPTSRTRYLAPMEPDLQPLGTGPTTRKTIEVPEDFYYRVKRRALDRRMKEKELWAEILYEYFAAHPTD